MTSDQLTISEVAERTGLTRHTLRYYERDGLMLGVGRASSGHRRYSERDLGWIELITKLRATGQTSRFRWWCTACLHARGSRALEVKHGRG
jgi:hypothetical protein